MRITEKKLRNIIRNIVLENRLPGGKQMTSISKMLRSQFPGTPDKGLKFMVHTDGMQMRPEHLAWLLSQEGFKINYSNASFKVSLDEKGNVNVTFDNVDISEE